LLLDIMVYPLRRTFNVFLYYTGAWDDSG